MKRAIDLFALGVLALRRLWRHKGLAFCLLLGLIAAVSLTVSIPLYTDAISHRVLNTQLIREADRRVPPFSFLFRYVGSWNGFLEWEDCQAVDRFITQNAGAILDLPVNSLVRHFKTDKVQLLPSAETPYADTRKAITYVTLGFISDVEAHIDIVEGAWPQSAASGTGPIEVLVPFKLVESFGLQSGETYIVNAGGVNAGGVNAGGVNAGGVNAGGTNAGGTNAGGTSSFKVRIAGVWQARDPDTPYWFYAQPAFEDLLLMPEASYVQMSRTIKGEVGLAVWSLICDGSALRSQGVPTLVANIISLHNKVGALLTRIELVRSPQDALLAHMQITQSLTVLLYMFSAPVLAVVFYFISLIAGMIVQRQRNEIAVLRSRGMSTAQVVGIYLLEVSIIGGPALVLGALLGERFAQLMGLTRTFLSLESRPLLATMISWPTLRVGLLAIAVSLIAILGPTVEAARETIVSYKREQARARRAPLWQRMYLDLVLVLPALYGLWVLRGRGSVAPPPPEGTGIVTTTASSFSDPLPFAVPVLLMFGLALLTVRIFPAIMHLLAWLVNAWRGAVPVLVFRHLARTARQHIGPLFLLTLTLGLAVFTASMARTLDDYTLAKAYYDVGADLRLVEMGESTPSETTSDTTPTSQGDTTSPQGPQWLFLPLETHLNIEGVEAAARMWLKTAEVTLPNKRFTARLMGIDRIDVPGVVFFRSDFAPASLGALMNALALRNDGVLISREIAEYGVEIGDKIELVLPMGNNPRAKLTVVGMVDLFPCLYPEDGPFLIANLEHLFNLAGGIYPYDVWLKSSHPLDSEGVQIAARNLGLNVTAVYNASAQVQQAMYRPDRQGVFGLLSIGFIVSAMLTVLGFLIYAYLSFWQRQIELGMLRALGLSVGQMALVLVIEQFTLILTGALAGTGIGVLIGRVFIPFLQVGSGTHAQTPPFVVQTAWTEIVYIYAILGLMFIVAIVIMLLFLRRLRIFEVIKLGEAT